MGNNLYSNLVNFYNVNDENFKEFMAEIYKEMLTTHRDVQYVKEHLTEEIEKILDKYLVGGKFNINIEEKVNEFLNNNQEIKDINSQMDTITKNKYDDVIISGNELSMKANGVVKKIIQLPSAGGTHSPTTTIFNELNTINKTIIGAINELFALIKNNGSGNISNASETAITQQYSTSHEATPNNPSPPDGAYNWVTKPRINPDGSFPQSTWNAIGHWMTTYKVQGSSYYDNVGLLLQDPKAWIWNTNTRSWDVLSDDFEWGTWYREDFWDDGNGNITGTTQWETGVSGNHSIWVKIKQTSESSGRCFHPWGYQKNWRSNSNWANNGQPYIVTKVDFKLIKYDENGVDNLDKLRLVVNSGADWWRNVGDTWQPDWSTSRDMAVGKYILATKELKRAWCTNLPQNWQYGLPE